MSFEIERKAFAPGEHFYGHPSLVERSGERFLDQTKVEKELSRAIKPFKTCTVINLFGGPGAGKSTLSAGVFYVLKRLGVNCELVTEYAKRKVWEESFKTLEDQLYVLAKQEHSQAIAADKVDVLITDAPTSLSLYYGKNLSPTFKALVREVCKKYDNLNYLVERGNRKYNPAGRTQTKEGAIAVDNGVEEVLDEEKIPYKRVESKAIDENLSLDEALEQMFKDETLKQVVRDVLEHLNEKGK